MQMEEEGVPSTALREVSLLQMLNESNHVVKYAVPHLAEGMLLYCCLSFRVPSK